jgi:hypothetical protein
VAHSKHALQAVLLSFSTLLLSACLSSGSDDPTNTTGGGGSVINPAESTGRVFLIHPGPDATEEMVKAMVQLKPKDILRFDCGFFDLKTGIQITTTEDVIIEGCGMDETFLSFRDSTSQEGFLASNVRGVTVRNLTIGDSPGDAFKMKGVNHGTLKKVRAIWSSGRKLPEERAITAANFKKEIKVACTDPARHNPANPNPLETDNTSPDYTVSTASGRYGIYPVESRNILVEETESIGASDAGIYVAKPTLQKFAKAARHSTCLDLKLKTFRMVNTPRTWPSAIPVDFSYTTWTT